MNMLQVTSFNCSGTVYLEWEVMYMAETCNLLSIYIVSSFQVIVL